MKKIVEIGSKLLDIKLLINTKHGFLIRNKLLIVKLVDQIKYNR